MTLTQTLILIIQITTSYRAIELGLPMLWLGIIATGFAIIPVFTALQVGRWIDRGNEHQGEPDRRHPGLPGLHRAFGVAAIEPCTCSGSACFWASATCSARPAIRRRQCARVRPQPRSLSPATTWLPRRWTGAGPFCRGMAQAAQAALPPTGLLSAIGLIAATLSVLVALLIKAAPPKAWHHDSGNFMPVGRLLKLRGFPAVMLSSVATVTTLDLLVIYLPALGSGTRLINANKILGLLLTVRAAASLVSRAFYARPADLPSAACRSPWRADARQRHSFLVLAFRFAADDVRRLVLFGFAIGIASTLTLSVSPAIAPPEVCGTALTLRMTGNRVGQIVFPRPPVAWPPPPASGVFCSRSASAWAASGIAVAMSRPPADILTKSKSRSDPDSHGRLRPREHRLRAARSSSSAIGCRPNSAMRSTSNTSGTSWISAIAPRTSCGWWSTVC